MQKPYDEVVFQTNIEPFYTRVWKVYIVKFLFKHILTMVFLSFTVASLFMPDAWLPIPIILILILLVDFLYNFIQSYKWASCKITRVTFADDIFTIESTCKDERQTFKIRRADINTRLHWRIPNRQTDLMLHINNGATNIITVYACRKADEFDLENIPYQIYRIKDLPPPDHT